MPRYPLRIVLVSVLLAAAACGDDGADQPADAAVDHPPCVRHAEPSTGDLAADMVGRWHLVRHYTDTRYYEFHDDGTADVWYVGLGETDTHTTVAWSVDDAVVHTDESPPVDFVMALAPSPIGDVWRAPAEYVFRPCES